MQDFTGKIVPLHAWKHRALYAQAAMPPAAAVILFTPTPPMPGQPDMPRDPAAHSATVFDLR